jgi:hypothetical protein
MAAADNTAGRRNKKFEKRNNRAFKISMNIIEQIKKSTNPFITSYMIKNVEDLQKKNEEMESAIKDHEKISAEYERTVTAIANLNKILIERQKEMAGMRGQADEELEKNIIWLSRFREIAGDREKRLEDLRKQRDGLKKKTKK